MSFIDERVVEMRFDNAQFEKNVQTSLSTLDKLKAALKLDGSTKGLDALQKSTNTFDISPLADAVNTVNDRFSAMGVIGTTALVNITNKAINAGEALVKSLSVDNISAGWEKFGDKTTSVATLVAQGYDLSKVEDQMERLNWFTDETSYNFTDMVSNISKFTASGQELEPSVTAMEGIATWAALCGQNATTASRAMYQLSQAMGKGVLKYDDWKSIQNASMDTVEFRKKAVEAAEALSIVKKIGDDAYEITSSGKKFSLAEMFTSDALSKEQWFSADVMMKTFNEYSGAVEQIYEFAKEHNITASEAIDALGDSVDAFGLKAFLAAQQARTFRDVIDATKDAVSTGWMNTFEIIFGNYEEATELWSNLAEIFYDIFAASSIARNGMLKVWKSLGGRDLLLKTISTAFEQLIKILEPAKNALVGFFPNENNYALRAKTLINATQTLLNVIENLSITAKSSESLTKAFRGLYSFIALIVEGFGTLLRILKPLAQPVNILAGYFVDLLGAIGESITGFRQFTHSSSKFASVINMIAAGVKTFSDILSIGIILIAEFIKRGLKMINLNAAITSFNKHLKTLATRVSPYFKKITSVVDSVIKKFQSLFSLADIRSGFTNALSTIGEKFNVIATMASKAFDKILPYLNAAKTKVTEFFNSFRNGSTTEKSFNIFETIGNAASKVGEKLNQAKTVILNFVDSVRNAKSPLEVARNIFDSVKKTVLEFKDAVVKFANDKGLGELVDKIKTGANDILTKIQELSASRVLLFVFGVAVTTMMLEIGNAASKAAGMFKSLTTIPSMISTTITKIGRLAMTNSILQVAEAIGILALSLFLLAKADTDKLKEAAAALLLLSGAMAVIAIVMNRFGSDSGFAANATGIIALSGAVLLLAISLGLLANIEFKDLTQSLKILGIFALGLVAVSKVLTFSSKATWPAIAALIAFAFSIQKIVDAFVRLTAQIDNGTVEEALDTLKVMMIGLTVMAVAAGRLSGWSGVGMMGLILSLNMLIGAIHKIAESDVDLDLIMNNAEKFEAIFLILAGVFAATLLAGKHALGGAAAILAVGVTMNLLIPVLQKIDELEFWMGNPHFEATLLTFISMMGLIALFMVGTAMVGPHAIKGAVALLAITGVMYLFVDLMQTIDAIKFENYERTREIFVGMGIIVGGLMALSALTGKAKIGAILAIMMSMGILLSAIAILSDPSFDQDRVMKVAAGIAIALGGLGVCFMLAGNLAATADPKMMLGIAACLTILIGGLIIVADMSRNLAWSQLLAAAGAIAIVLVGFAGAMAIMGAAAKLAKDSIKGAAAILIVSLSLIPVAAAMAIVASAFMAANTEVIATTIGGLILVMFAMAGAANMADKAILGAAAMAVMAGSLLIIGISLSMIATIPEADLNRAMISLGIIVGVFAILGAISAGTSGAFAVGLEAVAAALLTLSAALIGIGAAALLFAFAVDTIVNALLKLAGITDEQANQIGENIIRIMSDMGTALAEGLTNFIITMANNAGKIVDAILQAILNGTGPIVEGGKNLIQNFIESVGSKISDVIAAAQGIINSVIETIVGGVTGMRDAAVEAVKNFIDGIDQSVKDAVKAVTDFVGKVVEEVKTAAEGFYDSAVDCVKGFAQGFMEDTIVGQALGAVGDLGKKVLSRFNQETGVASPSKKFARSGYFCVAGFVKGFEKSQPDAKKASEQMAATIIESFNDRMGIHSPSTEGEDSIINYGLGMAKGAKESTPLLKNVGTALANTVNESTNNALKGKGTTLIDGFLGKAATAFNGSPLNIGVQLTGDPSADLQNILGGATGLFEHNPAADAANETATQVEGAISATNENTEATNTNAKASKKAARSASSAAAATGQVSTATDEATKQIDMLTNIMDYASDEVMRFKNEWAETKHGLSGDQALSVSKDALELLALQLYENSIASETAEEAAERMGKTQAEVAADIKQAYLDMRKGVQETLQGQIDMFKMFDFGETATAKDMLERAKSNRNALLDYGESIAKLGEKVAGIRGGEKVLQHFVDEGATSLGDLKGVLEMSADQLSEYLSLFDDMPNLLDYATESTVSSMAYVGYKAAGGFAEGLKPEEGAAAADNFSVAILDKLREKFGVNLQGDGVSTVTKSIGEGIAKGITTSLDGSTEAQKATSESEQLGSDISTAVNTTATDGSYQIGKNICEGIAKGISENASTAINAAVDMAIAALEGAKNALGINSPSKAFEDVGFYSDQGLANGFFKYGTIVREAAADTAYSAVDELTGVFGHIADLIDGTLELDPTIRPVLDLTNLADGNMAISSMLGLNDPYALNAAYTGIQNGGAMIADLTASFNRAIDKLNPENGETRDIVIHIYPTENQNPEDIANAVSYKINHEVLKKTAARGGAS